jgi:cytochrome c biogenesis protein CcdA
MDPFSFILGFCAGFLILGMMLLFLRLLLPWRRAMFHATGIGLMHILGMLWRGNPPGLIVDAVIALRMQGHTDVNCYEAEACYTANRHSISDVRTLVELVEAQRATASAPKS